MVILMKSSSPNHLAQFNIIYGKISQYSKNTHIHFQATLLFMGPKALLFSLNLPFSPGFQPQWGQAVQSQPRRNKGSPEETKAALKKQRQPWTLAGTIFQVSVCVLDQFRSGSMTLNSKESNWLGIPKLFLLIHWNFHQSLELFTDPQNLRV